MIEQTAAVRPTPRAWVKVGRVARGGRRLCGLCPGRVRLPRRSASALESDRETGTLDGVTGGQRVRSRRLSIVATAGVSFSQIVKRRLDAPSGAPASPYSSIRVMTVISFRAHAAWVPAANVA